MPAFGYYLPELTFWKQPLWKKVATFYKIKHTYSEILFRNSTKRNKTFICLYSDILF